VRFEAAVKHVLSRHPQSGRGVFGRSETGDYIFERIEAGHIRTIWYVIDEGNRVVSVVAAKAQLFAWM